MSGVSCFSGWKPMPNVSMMLERGSQSGYGYPRPTAGTSLYQSQCGIYMGIHPDPSGFHFGFSLVWRSFAGPESHPSGWCSNAGTGRFSCALVNVPLALGQRVTMPAGISPPGPLNHYALSLVFGQHYGAKEPGESGGDFQHPYPLKRQEEHGCLWGKCK